MKLIHLSDLHIGKRVHAFSMISDQKYILNEILKLIGREQPDAVLIAGDIYDKPVPSAEAVEVFDGFLVALSEIKIPVFLISGNHDSAERLAFASRILKDSRIYVSPVYRGEIRPVRLQDHKGEVCIYMLPFVRPAQVKAQYPEAEIETYNDAVRTAVSHMHVDPEKRNVLLTHQFVTGAQACESEELSVGGTDQIDASVFQDFDYVALGHLHGPQSVTRPTVRYCGTPLKYSFSETAHRKSVTIVQLEEKGNVTIRTEPLVPLRDMKKISGTYMEVTDRSFYEGQSREDYFHITLTDEEDIPEAVGRLRAVYPNLMQLEYDNHRTRGGASLETWETKDQKTPEALFSDFYKAQNNRDMSPEQQAFLSQIIEKIWEEEE